jgi:lipoate-protein ligase A
VRQALSGILPDIERAGTSDLAAGGRKFSGNSQQRKRTHLLHHGTLLYDFDIAQIGRFLRMPGRQPEYRGGREHGEFLQNLPADLRQLKERLRDAWNVQPEVTACPEALVRQLVGAKFGDWVWVSRR